MLNGDLLVAKITPCFENGKIGQVRLATEIGVGSTEFHVVRPREGVDCRYLLHFLRTPRVNAAGQLRMTGSGGQRRVPVEYLRELNIPLPPLDEQRRIAAILDRVDHLGRRVSNGIETLDKLDAALFAQCLSRGPVQEIALEELSSGAGEYGAPVASVEATPEKPRYVRITDIDSQGRLNEEIRAPDGPASAWDRHRLQEGDLLFARSGATVGKTYLYRAEDGPCVYAGYLIRFRLRTDLVQPEFVFGYTRHPAYFAWVRARQNVVAQPNINARQYGRDLLVPIPALKIQREYAQRVLALMNHRSLLVRKSQALRLLAASLQTRAFSGEL